MGALAAGKLKGKLDNVQLERAFKLVFSLRLDNGSMLTLSRPSFLSLSGPNFLILVVKIKHWFKSTQMRQALNDLDDSGLDALVRTDAEMLALFEQELASGKPKTLRKNMMKALATQTFNSFNNKLLLERVN